MYVKMGKFPKTGERKIDIQIDGYDTWNADNTLAHVIYPMLLQLKATKHGVPSEFVEFGGEDYDQQQSFDFYLEGHNEYFEQGVARWEETLDKMIWSFQQIALEDYEDKYHHGKGEYDWVESDKMYPNPVTGKMEKTFQMVDKNPDEHWYDIEGHQLHEERMREGFELFGKYFQNLWD